MELQSLVQRRSERSRASLRALHNSTFWTREGILRKLFQICTHITGIKIVSTCSAEREQAYFHAAGASGRASSHSPLLPMGRPFRMPKAMVSPLTQLSCAHGKYRNMGTPPPAGPCDKPSRAVRSIGILDDQGIPWLLIQVHQEARCILLHCICPLRESRQVRRMSQSLVMAAHTWLLSASNHTWQLLYSITLHGLIY